jgi:hypothetical protein
MNAQWLARNGNRKSAARFLKAKGSGDEMCALNERILRDTKNLGRGILKVDGFINHQVDPGLMFECGRETAGRFRELARGCGDRLWSSQDSVDTPLGVFIHVGLARCDVGIEFSLFIFHVRPTAWCAKLNRFETDSTARILSVQARRGCRQGVPIKQDRPHARRRGRDG